MALRLALRNVRATTNAAVALRHLNTAAAMKAVKYTSSHEWVEYEDGGAPSEYKMGVTEYAQSALGEIVFIEMPAVGDTFETQEEIGAIESVKAASDLYAPVDMTITEVNETLADKPSLVNEDAVGKGWLVKFTAEDHSQVEALMSESDYKTFLKESAGDH